jgi:3-deoxy-D-manno-octulosonate 8-phosphate phosphatase KdsC-like HAD superfamily phosphatase
LQQLKDHGVPISVGRSIIGTTSSHEQTVLEIIQELGLDWHIILNKGAVMILPPGVNKATGLSALLKQLGIPPQQVVAVGDAENDQAFLQFCGYPVAVANALPAIKQIAAFVTSSPRGAGVSELITRMLEDSLPPNNKPGPSV